MKKLFILALLPLFISCQPEAAEDDFNAVQYVDPQIGSVHGRWFFYTPASLPFGMAKLAPHTNAYESLGSWLPGGYDDRHTSIEGFGHFHEFQIGGVVAMPFTGRLKTIPGTLENPDEGYRSRFEKEDEHSEAGYYSVLLKDYQVKVELTATERVGFHRYTFPESDSSGILFDIGHKQGESSDVTEAFARVVDEKMIEGWVETYPEYAKFCDPGNRVKMYFVARLNKVPEEVGIFYDSIQLADSTSTLGVRNGLYLGFSTMENEVVEMQVGLSYTSLENARLNLNTETSEQSFDQVHKEATGKWNEMLGRIRVEGSNTKDIIKFYTGLYHALLGRGLASDVNGQYARNDGGIGQIPLDQMGHPEYRHFNSDGVWGGFWNLGQLWALVYPDYLVEYVQSNIDFYGETGWLHDGVAAGVFTNGVQTNFQALLMAAAYNCGIRGFDLETGYEAALKNETEAAGRNLGNGKYDMHWFNSLGYVPSWDTTLSNGWVFNFGGSHTLEYCFSSYAVAQMARGLGHEEDYQKLMQQAGNWKLIFDPETRFIRPRYPDGSYIENFDPLEGWRGFQEGNAYQYTWYVPHDIAGLMDEVGHELFNERLEQMFEDAQKSLFGGGKEIHSFSGVEMLYNHGNQPCLHNAWLFNYSGKPWLTQRWTRAICQEFYGTEALHGYGYGQDEDQGQLGAWYVMASLGLFDVQGHAGAQPTFQFGSPLFEKVSLQLAGDPDNILIIKAEGQAPESSYIQALNLNGQTIGSSWIIREELMQGGTLTFTMGPEPNKEWGIDVPPPSMISPELSDIKVPVYAWLGGPGKATDEEIRDNFTDLKNKGIIGLLYNGGHDPETYKRVGGIAHEVGLEFQTWIPTMIQGENPKLPPDLYAWNGLGESAWDKPAYAAYYKFLCPNREEVYLFLEDLYLKIAGLEEVDGIHLDYIRFPDVILARGLWDKYGLVMDKEYPQYDYCYCDHCVEGFKSQSGIDIRSAEDPSQVEEWKQYRYDLITSIVSRLTERVHASGKEITAAVFPGPNSVAKQIVRQEWDKWSLDAFFPMNYNDFYLEDTKWVGKVTLEGVTALDNRKPLYSGLFICPKPEIKSQQADPENHGLLPEELEDAIRESMENGAAGICLFTPGRMTDAHWAVFEKAIRKDFTLN